MTTNGSYIISWDFSHVTDDENSRDRAVLIVCKQTKGVMNIYNKDKVSYGVLFNNITNAYSEKGLF